MIAAAGKVGSSVRVDRHRRSRDVPQRPLGLAGICRARGVSGARRIGSVRVSAAQGALAAGIHAAVPDRV